jgi:predicted peptidase
MRTFLFLAATVVSSFVTAGETQSEQSFSGTVTKSVTYRYLLSLPAGYDASRDPPWPLLLFLHGSGERGEKLADLTKHGPPKLVRDGARLTEHERAAGKILAEKFIVVSPQCPDDEVWDEDGLLALLDDVMPKLRVDRTRVYLTGISMGGYGAWALFTRAPERFAAVVPICGGGRTIEFFVSGGRKKKAAFRSAGVWAFHGADDPTVPVSESQHMIGACRRAGVKDVELTIYPKVGHDSWTETYARADLYAWLLRHARR